MKLKLSFTLLFSMLSFVFASDLILNIEPKAKKVPHQLIKHGQVRIDNYFWLKDKKNPEVLDYLKTENDYTKMAMRDTEKLQEKLYQEMKQRVKEEDQSVPFKEGHYFYYSRTQKGDEYPRYCRKKDPNGPEEVLIDVNELGQGKDYIKVTHPLIHPNEQLMAYAIDTKGDRVYSIYFKDLQNNFALEQKIENVSSNFVWGEDSKVLYYASMDPQTLRANKIFRYDLESKKSTLLYEEKDEKFEVFVKKTLSRKFILITSASTLSSEVRFFAADKSGAPLNVFLPRGPRHEYSIDDDGERFIVRTNDHARNFRLMSAPYRARSKKEWKVLLPHDKNIFIEDLDVFKDHLVVTPRENGLIQLLVLKKGEHSGEKIKFPDPAYFVHMENNAEFDTHFVRYDFQSLNRPSSIFDYDTATKTSAMLKEETVPTYNSDLYQSERIMAPARDGVQVPVSLVYKKGLVKNATSPLLIYGYGAYGMSNDAYFNPNIVSLLDRGFVYAIAHVRGGSELGRKWYEDGKFLKKKNTFNDFIDSTLFLVREKYADPKKIYANGGSAGGLLMGAVINMRPDLYRGVVADVPFVDVVTTMLDSSLPLTTGEYEEWGDPNNKKFYDYMLSYSPYDNVQRADYPNLLVTTGLNDSQVSYWEPAKWVAKLRELRTDKSKLLMLKIEMDVGHGGKSGRFTYLKDEAFSTAFYLKLEGKNQ